MPGTAIIVQPNELPAVVDRDILDEAADHFAAASKSDATRRAYRSDARNFIAWCNGQGVDPMPAEPRTVKRYLVHLASLGLSVSTIDRRVSAIAAMHRAKGEDSPTTREEVRAVLTGIRNTLAKPPNKKQALTDDLVRKVVKRIKLDLTGLRDRAMILTCFAMATRRSELVALDVADLEWHRKGVLVRLRRSKTDQQAKGRTLAIPHGKMDIPEAIRAWLDASGVKDGPLFRGCDRGKISSKRMVGGSFARILKRRCAAVGLDPDLISGHSPRRGLATTAADKDGDLRRIAKHMRHVKLETTAGYVEDAEAFKDHVGKSFL